MTLPQRPQDEAVSLSAQAQAAPLEPSPDEAPGQSELWDVLLAACRAGDVGMLKLQLAASPTEPSGRPCPLYHLPLLVSIWSSHLS